jgi:hypothetical protein
MRTTRTVLLLCLPLLLTGWAAGQTPDLKHLYEQHRWAELRERLKTVEAAPPLYSGAVASAWNHITDAEKDLKEVIEGAPDSAEAAEAHEQLGYIYARSGRYRDVVRELDSILRTNPGRADVRNIRLIYSAFAKHEDQSIERYRPTAIHADISKEGIVLPISTHGKTVHWLLDTDFNMCAMSESEAKLLGVVTTETPAQAGDFASGTVKVRTAVINELSIGAIRIHNVAFLVIPDSQPPMNGLPPGHRGLIGFPVVWAMRALEWTNGGRLNIGFPPENHARSESNLFFDGLSAVTKVGYDGKNLDFILDTGNVAGTELWQRFANDFPDVIKLHGIQKKQTLTEIGGSRDRETTVLPEVELRIGGFETTLRPAPIFAKPVGDDFHHGLLGMDLLSRAREVRIDFRSMTLQLLP